MNNDALSGISAPDILKARFMRCHIDSSIRTFIGNNEKHLNQSEDER
jgi:hypothetical protein